MSKVEKSRNAKEVAKEKAKMGAPTKYRPEYCQLLIEHMGNGFSYHSFAGVVGVCYDTLHEWEKIYPDFSDAKSNGQALLLYWDEKLLGKGAEGKQRGYNFNAHKWKMTNIHKWSDRVETVAKPPKDLNEEEQ